MKTNFNEKFKGMLEFECENDDERVYCVIGTIYGDGDSFARFMTDKDIEEEGWYDGDEWSKDISEMEIGESSTFGYWHYDKANVIVRVA